MASRIECENATATMSHLTYDFDVVVDKEAEAPQQLSLAASPTPGRHARSTAESGALASQSSFRNAGRVVVTEEQQQVQPLDGQDCTLNHG